MAAIIAWARQQYGVPVWLVGTSRGTQSVGYAATQLHDAAAPDGIVLTSTIVADPRGRAVSEMALKNIRIPVLLVHHEQDGCRLCAFREVPGLLEHLSGAPRKSLVALRGGETRGDPCEAWAYHGYNGIESEAVAAITAFITPP